MWGTLKSVLSNRGLRIKAKKRLYDEVIIVQTALYGTEAWGMSFTNVCQEWIVRNEEVNWRAGIETEFASRADKRVLR